MSQKIKIGLSISVKVCPAILMGTKRNNFEKILLGAPKSLMFGDNPSTEANIFGLFLLASELEQDVQKRKMY